MPVVCKVAVDDHADPLDRWKPANVRSWTQWAEKPPTVNMPIHWFGYTKDSTSGI